MFDCIEAWRRHSGRRTLKVGSSVAVAALIAGCSYVPDAVNPVEWYKGVAGMFEGDEAPVVAAPRRPDGSFPNVNEAGAKSSGRGLAGDRTNSQYAQSVRREPAPSKQLAKRPAQTEVAEAPAAAIVAAGPQNGKDSDRPSPDRRMQTARDDVPPPAPVPAPVAVPQGGRDSYQPSLDRRMQTARDDGPAAPPAAAPAGPPAYADIPDSVPRRGLLAEQYQRRLAESSAAASKGDAFSGIPTPRAAVSYNQPVNTYAVPAQPPLGMTRYPAFAADAGERPVNLAPPKGLRGARGMVEPKAPAAQFEVASVQFGPGGGLTATDGAQLRDVAALQKQTGGIVRVIGYGTPGGMSFVDRDDASFALGRAKAVAKSLTTLGVPARKIMVAADPAGAGAFDDSGAKVSIEY